MINFNNRTFSVVLFTNSEGWAKAAASRSAKTKKLFRKIWKGFNCIQAGATSKNQFSFDK